MPEVSLLTWTVGIAALIIGILAGHFGWGRGWLRPHGVRFSKLHPDYLAGLDYLVTEQPDRALDLFLKLMDANADTIETHFALGTLYRRRGEVERAIRIHQNLLARELLAPEHREQALLALAQDYLRAGVLDRAEALFQRVSETPRLRACALDALRGVYERQREWRQALDVYRLLARIKAAPGRAVAAHYLCELAVLAGERGEVDTARRLLREARREVSPFPRAAVLRAHIAERDGDMPLAIGLLRFALQAAPALLQEELPRLLRLCGIPSRDALLADLVTEAESQGADALRHLVFAAIAADLLEAAPLRSPMVRVFEHDPALRAVWQSDAPAWRGGVEAAASSADVEAASLSAGGAPEYEESDGLRRIANDIGALLAHAEKYRCNECGFAARAFYWHCPACHAWDSFEAYAVVKLG